MFNYNLLFIKFVHGVTRGDVKRGLRRTEIMLLRGATGICHDSASRPTLNTVNNSIAVNTCVA